MGADLRYCMRLTRSGDFASVSISLMISAVRAGWPWSRSIALSTKAATPQR